MQFFGILCAIAAALFWAIAVVLFKKSGDTFSPTALNLFKCLVTLALLVPTLLLAGTALFPAQPLSTWALLLLSGVTGITLADNLFFMALTRLGAGMWAVVDCLYLPFVIVLSTVFLDEAIGLKEMMGATLVVVAIFAGSYSRESSGHSLHDQVVGLGLGVLAVGLIAGSVILVKPLLVEVGVLWASFVRQLAGVAGLLVLAGVHPQRRAILGELSPSPSWKTALPAAVVGNYLAMLAWLAGFKYTLVSVAAILNQLTTIFTFVLAALFLKEPATLPRVVAVVLAVAGALLATGAI